MNNHSPLSLLQKAASKNMLGETDIYHLKITLLSLHLKITYMTKINHGMIRVCILHKLLRSVLKNFTGKHRLLLVALFFTKSSNQILTSMEIWHRDGAKCQNT